MNEMNRNFEGRGNTEPSGTVSQSVTSGLESAARTLRERGSEVVRNIRNSEVARNLQNSAAEAEHVLEETAETVRAKGNEAVNAVAKVSGRAMRYVRTHDTEDVVENLREVARRYPAQALAAALVAGFVVGRSFFRR